MTTRTLDWDTEFTSGDAPSTVTFGTVEVSFATANASGGMPASQAVSISSATLGATSNGHLRLEIDADVPAQGIVQSIFFDEGAFPFRGVVDVGFSLLDVDQGTFQDQVQIIAYDPRGNVLNPSVVTLTPAGAASSVSGDTATGQAAAANGQAIGNVEVSIAAEVGRVDVVFTAGPDATNGSTLQEVGIGPVSFTSVAIFDDSDGSDDGQVTGDDNDNVIFGGTLADGGLDTGAGVNASGADNDTTTPNDTIEGGGGNDRIYGGAGNDTIRGGEGRDTIFGGDGNNDINGGIGDDFIFGGSQGEILSGGPDGDFIAGGGGVDILNGNAGGDRFRLASNDVNQVAVIDGGSEFDALEINFSAAYPTADLRNATFQNVERIEFIADGDDATIEVLDTQVLDLVSIRFDGTNSASNTEVFGVTMDGLTELDLGFLQPFSFRNQDFVRIDGDGSAETITGTFISDVINGNGGADILSGERGDDTLNGGAGNDTLSGGEDDDILDGGADNDSIDGGEGDDTILASRGNDKVIGGEDEDTYDGSSAQNIRVEVTADGTGTALKGFGGGVTGTDTFEGIEVITAGETAPDGIAFTGTNGLSALEGFTDDAAGIFVPAVGGAVNFGPSATFKLSDVLNGNATGSPVGSYDIIGGLESAQIGGTAFENFELISFIIGPDGAVDGADTGQTMGLGFTDVEGDMITAGNDLILGNGGEDTIDGAGGNDTIDAGDEDDTVLVSQGSDELSGGDGQDTLSLQNSTAALNVVQLDVGQVQAAGFGTATISEFENVIGGSGTDQIFGSVEANIIEGRGGADVIDGRGGADVLIGNQGLDTFSSAASNWADAVSVDGGQGDDQLRVTVDQSSADLTAVSITSNDLLSLDGGSTRDFSVDLLAEQVTSNFTTIRTDSHDGFFRQINIEMADENGLDLSGITFTGFDQPGDRVFILGDDDNETIVGSDINDIIASGPGEDDLSGGMGDDVFGVFTGSATIDGGEGSDIYDAAFIDQLVASVDNTGAGTSNKFFDAGPNSADSFTAIETLIAGEDDSEDDAIFLTSEVSVRDVATAIQGLEDTAVGRFTDPDGNLTEFGLPGGYLLSDILNGTVPSGTTLPAVGPVGSYRILNGDEDGQIGDISFANFETIDFKVAQIPDGVVDGTDAGQNMVLGFTDIDGDIITDLADTILGNGGNDTIDGARGGDTIDGGAGEDILRGGQGDDTIDGGLDKDTISGQGGRDTIIASPGGDMINAGGQRDTYDARNIESVTVDAFASNGATSTHGTGDLDLLLNVENFVAGENAAESDSIAIGEAVGSSEIATAITGLTDDAVGTFTPSGGSVTAFGPTETYQLSHILGGLAPNGTDPALGPVGDYRITAGNEDGQVGAISFANFETITFSVVAQPDGEVDGTDDPQVMELGFTDVDGDAITTGADTIFGNGGADTIDGNDGDDTIDGGAGNDVFPGDPGADTVIGGIGDDTFDYAFSADMFGDVISGGAEGNIDNDVLDLRGIAGDFATIAVQAETDPNDDGASFGTVTFEDDSGNTLGVLSYSGIESVIFSNLAVDGTDAGQLMELGFTDSEGDRITDFSDRIFGNGGDDTIDGAGGNDFIVGGTGNDTIFGGEGDDTINGGAEDDLIEGGPGADDLDGGRGIDTLSYESSDGPVVINLALGTGGIFGDDGGDTYEDFENAIGSAFTDVIIGDDGENELSGLAGDDLLIGAGGNDTLIGGAGEDEFIGGTGADEQLGGADADLFTVDTASDLYGDTIDGGSDGDDDDTLDLSGLGPFRITGQTDDADGNSTSGTVEFLDSTTGGVLGSLDYSEIENIICFTPGTLIATQRGERPVEMLRPGDKVITRDNGMQEIVWAGRRDLTARELLTSPKLRPVFIRCGALGPDSPERDLWVSPHHRMLQTGASIELNFGESEVLTAAKHLTHLDGVRFAPVAQISYVHILFEHHQIVLGNGCWSESFCPGDQAMKAVTSEQRNELLYLFPELETQIGRAAYRPARRSLRKFEAMAI